MNLLVLDVATTRVDRIIDFGRCAISSWFFFIDFVFVLVMLVVMFLVFFMMVGVVLIFGVVFMMGV